MWQNHARSEIKILRVSPGYEYTPVFPFLERDPSRLDNLTKRSTYIFHDYSKISLMWSRNIFKMQSNREIDSSEFSLEFPWIKIDSLHEHISMKIGNSIWLWSTFSIIGIYSPIFMEDICPHIDFSASCDLMAKSEQSNPSRCIPRKQSRRYPKHITSCHMWIESIGKSIYDILCIQSMDSIDAVCIFFVYKWFHKKK